jgi:hypothetical protein
LRGGKTMKGRYITPTKSDLDRIGRIFFRGGSGSGLKYPDKKHCQSVKDALTLQEIVKVAIITWEAMRGE